MLNGIEQARKTPDNRQAEPQTFCPVANQIAHLKSFIKDLFAILGFDADAGIPQLVVSQRKVRTTKPPS